MDVLLTVGWPLLNVRCRGGSIIEGNLNFFFTNVCDVFDFLPKLLCIFTEPKSRYSRKIEYRKIPPIYIGF